jgi:carboxyl-terminal processing protease
VTGSRFLLILSPLSIVFLFFTNVRGASPPATERFEEVWRIVRDNFFDPRMCGVNWEEARERYAPQASRARSPEAFAVVINQMLAELRTSHTHYYTQQEPEFYQLCGIFWPVLRTKIEPLLSGKKLEYPGIGIVTKLSGDKVFVQAVFDGSPAAGAGLKIGDQIVSADEKPFHPISSFAGKVGRAVKIQVQRTADSNSTGMIAVTPRMFDPTKMFIDAMKASVKTIVSNGVKIGYIHVWSYAGEIYQEQLEEELNGRLSKIDALVLDLRDGWGGASPRYVWPLIAPALTISSISRNGNCTNQNLAWTKPICLLLNERSRSGKVGGTRSAGEVMGGRPFVLSDGSLLLVAVSDGLLDGIRPEGNGVIPDIEVPFNLEYSQGVDPQKERAVEVISSAARK